MPKSSKSRSKEIKQSYKLLWYAANVELIFGVAWVLLLVANVKWSTPEILAEVRLLGLHVLMPLTALFAIEYVFKNNYSVKYITRLTWIIPAAVTGVTDLVAAWLLFEVWHGEGVGLWSLSGGNFLLSLSLALSSVFCVIVLGTTQYKHSSVYETTEAFSHSKRHQFETITLFIALTVGIIGVFLLIWNLSS
jgi:hypothetical protein